MNLTVPAVLLLLTVAFGLWLSRSGKPYNGILFNIHKLAALGAVIFAGVQFYQLNKVETFPPVLVSLVLLIIAFVIGLFFSGAMMSADKLSYSVMRAIHRVAPIFIVVASAAAIYMLGR